MTPVLHNLRRSSKRANKMSAYIALEDGRSLWLPTVIMDGLLWRISQQISAGRSKLRRWLADKSKRPAPFLDLDVRGFSEADREEFYAAARKAMADEYAVNEGGSTDALVMLLKMKESMDRGEPPSALWDSADVIPFNGSSNDLDEIWGLCDD